MPPINVLIKPASSKCNTFTDFSLRGSPSLEKRHGFYQYVPGHKSDHEKRKTDEKHQGSASATDCIGEFGDSCDWAGGSVLLCSLFCKR